MSLQSSNDQLLSLRKTLNNAINDIEVIQMNKLDVHEFEKVRKSLEFKFETNQLGIKDNFSQLLATDNYLEKYLPFRIQMMISDSIENLIDPLWSSLQDLKQNKAAETLT